MKSNSVFNLILIIISLGVLAYFVMQLVNPTTDDSNEKNDDGNAAKEKANNITQKETEVVVRAPNNTVKKSVTFAEPVVSETKSNGNEQVIDYEPVVIRQEFPVTPLSFPSQENKQSHHQQIPQMQQPMQPQPIQPQMMQPQMMQPQMMQPQMMQPQMMQPQMMKQQMNNTQMQAQQKPMYI